MSLGKTCSEIRNDAEKRRRHVLNTLSGRALERELAKADKLIEQARDRKDCV